MVYDAPKNKTFENFTLIILVICEKLCNKYKINLMFKIFLKGSIFLITVISILSSFHLGRFRSHLDSVLGYTILIVAKKKWKFMERLNEL